MPSDLKNEELAASYAALILHDEKLPVTAEHIESLCKAAGVKVSNFWPKLYQQVFSGSRTVGDFLLSSVGSGGAAPAAGAAAPAAAGGAAPAAAAKEAAPAKKEESEEEDDDMFGGGGLFGDD